MLRKEIILFVYTLISINSYSQQIFENEGEIKNYQIVSKFLNEKKNIEIYLPPSYQKVETKKYPVMYVMDGQDYFLHPIAYQRMLHFKDKIPEFIVVGINMDRKKRRKLLYEDSEILSSFLIKELIPYIDENYRTLKENERIYFGWEMSGGFGLETLTTYPDAFNALFMASPTHITDDRINDLSKSILSNHYKPVYLHFSKAPEETYIEQSINKIDSTLKANKPQNIIWKIDNLLEEDHYSTPFKTINNGLRDHFKDYNTLRYYTLKEFDEFGNLDDIKSYYLHRGNRYGVSPDIHRTTQHFLLLNAMNEDNFERFTLYAEEFKSYLMDPILEVWTIKFGEYLTKNNKYIEALEIYEAGLKKFPQSAAIHNSIGSYYANIGDKSKAILHYSKAIEYAKRDNDPNRDKYISDLEKL